MSFAAHFHNAKTGALVDGIHGQSQATMQDTIGHNKRKVEEAQVPTHAQRAPQLKRPRPTPIRKERKKAPPPSEETLAFSRHLQQLSRQRPLSVVLDHYWHPKHDELRDEHHACIVIDYCARSRNVTEAEKIVRHLCENAAVDADYRHLSVPTQTALIKAYALAGRLHDAQILFLNMLQQPDARQRPNVRTLNTLLRGCLWTPAYRVPVGRRGPDPKSGVGDNDVAGGIVTAQKAWKAFVSVLGDESLDASSYEYYGTMLGQAMRLSEAQALIDAWMQRHNVLAKGKASFTMSASPPKYAKSSAAIVADQANVMETLAVLQLAVTRARALQGQGDAVWTHGQRTLHAIKLARDNSSSDKNDGAHETWTKSQQKRLGHGARGGKQAWKRGTEDAKIVQRVASNTAFRGHRLDEMEHEARHLLTIRTQLGGTARHDGWQEYLASRLAVLAAGAGDEPPCGCQIPLNLSFGVDAKRTSHLTDRKVSVHRICKDPALPLDVELGAGFGDWIVRQAAQHSQRNHVAVEMRADRAYQIFCRTLLRPGEPLDNVAVVVSDAATAVKHFSTLGLSISTLYVNHPEPPSQVYGENAKQAEDIMKGGAEPAHMLNSSMLFSAAERLHRDGRMVIVTDNANYAQLLCATLHKAITLLHSPLKSCKFSEPNVRTVKSVSKLVHVWNGAPGPWLGHAAADDNAGSSYFDRLWKTGAGKHADKNLRFIIALQRVNRSPCSSVAVGGGYGAAGAKP